MRTHQAMPDDAMVAGAGAAGAVGHAAEEAVIMTPSCHSLHSAPAERFSACQHQSYSMQASVAVHSTNDLNWGPDVTPFS